MTDRDNRPETETDRMVARMAASARTEARADVERERARREESDRRHQAELERIRRELDQAREDARAERERAREEASRQQMELLRSEIAAMRNAQPARPSMDLTAILTAASAIVVPITTALITAGSSRRSSEFSAQQLAIDGQNKMLMAMLQQKPSESEFVKLLPALLPLAKTFLEMRDPGKQAQMWSVLGEQMLTQAQLAGDMMRSIAESQPDQPAWMPLATTLFEGVERYAKAIAESQGMGGGAAMRQQQPEVVQGAPMGAVAASADGQPAPPPRPPRPASAPPENATQQQKMDHVMPQLPTHFHNQEWGEIIYFMLMGDLSNVGGIALAISDLMHKLDEAGAVPPDLEGVLDHPEQIGPAFIDLIPMKPDFRAKVYKATVSVLRSPGGSAPQSNGHGQDEEQPATRVM